MSFFENIKEKLGLGNFAINGEQIVHLLGLDKPEKIKALISEHWPTIEPMITNYVKSEQEKAGGKLSVLADVENDVLRVQILLRKEGEKSQIYKTFTSETAPEEFTKLLNGGENG